LRQGGATSTVNTIFNATDTRISREEEDFFHFNDSEEAEEKWRRLKGSAPKYCPEFQFEVAIDGAVKTYNLTTWRGEIKRPVARVMGVWPIFEDPGFTGSTVEVAIRMSGCGNTKFHGLTHVYWA
jgi:hypothetical protein